MFPNKITTPQTNSYTQSKKNDLTTQARPLRKNRVINPTKYGVN